MLTVLPRGDGQDSGRTLAVGASQRCDPNTVDRIEHNPTGW
jgi:hypothetical protein